MVMEYVEGHTLDLAIKTRGRLSAAESLDILTPIMSVLDTAHSMGVVHRDLKPENIMIGKPDETGQPVVKLLDLGIAKMREIAGDNGGNTALTMAGQVLGTPYYMSPEQWGEIPRDGSSEIDGRADVYSLGLVFYEMIAGRRCFAGNTLHELRREHVQTRPRPLIEVIPDVPRGFSDAIERATAKDRGDRQPSAGALASELRAGLSTPSGQVVGAPSPALTETVVSDSRETNADVNAPTILTVDAATPTSPAAGRAASTHDATVYEPAKPQTGVAATIAEPGRHAETVTVPHVPHVSSPAPSPPVAVAPPAASKSKVGLVIGVVVVFVILLVGGVGGFLVWNKMKSSGTSTTPTNVNTTGVASAPVEVSRYWLSLEPKGKPKTQVAALVPIASGQEFRFYFKFNEDGYVYIVGPGDKNQPMAFLTTKPSPGTGVTSNRVSKEVDFTFPKDDAKNVHTLTLDAHPGTDHFTVIFSKTPLSSPTFFSEPVTGDPLTAAQQAELKDFISRYQSKPPVTELDESNARAPFVRVKAVPDQTSNPIVFDIRIQHN
jgi:hypothetical protein